MEKLSNMVESTSVTETRVINTLFGKVTYKVNDIILFPEGIIGFEDKSKYIIYTKEGFEPFQWLICIDDISLQLPIIEPYLVKKDYNAKSNNGELQSIGLDDSKSGKLYLIVTVGKDINNVTVNLRGPIVINTTRKLGKQIILSDSSYSLKQPLLAGSQN